MQHGKPNWFELTTLPGALGDAGAFYKAVFGWDIAEAGVGDTTYHVAQYGGVMVAGLMETPAQISDLPPAWTVYFDADDVDAAAAKAAQLGGTVLSEPADIDNTGRFSIIADPQGTAFGLLQSTPMGEPETPAEGAFYQNRESHANWIELSSSDPVAGLEFYLELLGWTKSPTAMDMGDMGKYQLFQWQGTDIGGAMGLMGSPVPHWLPYFGVNGVKLAITRIKDAGGTLINGHHEVPGPAFIAVATDPQGAHFAIVGPLDEAG